MTAGSSIDYDALTQDALRSVVRAVLNQVVAKGGLPGDHHFYIAFDTRAPDVVMSRRLKEKYPEEMMIVLQHRFWDLAVTDEGFEVKLTFDGIPERLYIPFPALRVFFDPSVRFTLQFGDLGGDDQADHGNRRRQGGDRRGRPRPGRPRQDQSADGTLSDSADPTPAQPQTGAQAPAVPVSQPSPPAVFAPRPVPVPVTPGPAPASVPATSESSPAEANPPAKEGSGAKVFSLDQFRNKK
jgi:hypothetical protein